jgi:hypothetical protein
MGLIDVDAVGLFDTEDVSGLIDTVDEMLDDNVNVILIDKKDVN